VIWRALPIALLALIGCERRDPAPAQPDRSSRPAVASAAAAPRADPPPPPTGSRRAAAPNEPSKPPARPDPEPGARTPRRLLDRPPASFAVSGAAWHGPIDPKADAGWLAQLAAAPITEIVRNRGGATITLQVRLAGGSRALFKPEQTHSASNHRAEIAAFHLDRVLGFGRTAPVVGRSVRASTLRRWLELGHHEPEWLERFEREVIVRDGAVQGALIAWHSKRLVNAEPPKNWTHALLDADAGSLPPERALEWSDLVVFDYLLDNTDRWSGGNVLALGDGGPLVFLDNAAGFVRGGIAEPSQRKIGAVCRFRHSTFESLARASGTLGQRISRSLAGDPLAPVLSEQRLSALDQRLERLIVHMARCIADHGRGSVIAD
jgi:hypothetical protein